MSNIAIEFESISKQYRLGTIGTGTISHDLNRWWHLVRGKEDPYLKVGEVNDRSLKAASDYVWALRDITFDVEKGEVLGIIGKNGAGKSTLLKILSRVTSPSTGHIRAKGRIASLLEVGTGFHPEMTGRENVYMNGAIMGMTRHEITSKLDEIVAFSGVEKYIDTPVKRYSSGMTVRLGFAVAAHLEPEILVVDEVLAVGDAEFQKKAIGKMKDVSQGGGRTVLFVSHNMGAVKSLCTKGLILKNGTVVYSSSASDAVDEYLRISSDIETVDLSNRTDRKGKQQIKATSVVFLDREDKSTAEAISGSYLKIRINFERNTIINYSRLFVGIAIFDQYENKIVSFLSDEMGSSFQMLEKRDYIDLVIPNLYLRSGEYNLTIQLGYGTTREEDLIDLIDNAAKLHVIEGDIFNIGKVNRSGNFAIFPANYI